jgi:hypothetical protein
MNRNNLRGIFWFIPILISFLFAQETHNLEIIWQKASPDSVTDFGRCIASGDVNGDGFSDILVLGDSVIESPPHSDSSYRGICWIYYGGTSPDTIPDIRLNNPQKTLFLRLHSRDINGDGFDDIILGAPYNAGGYGEVFIFLGGDPMDTICDYSIRGSVGGSQFGDAVSTGNVNRDSFNDVIVGAWGDGPMPGGYDMGRVYIYFGSRNFDTYPDVKITGGHEGQREGLGTTVGSGADVNGDGFEDVIIGAPNFSSGSFWGEGRIYIYYGGNPMDTSYDVAMTGDVPSENLGWTPTVNLLRTEFEYDMAVFGSEFWPYGFPRVGPGKVYVLFGGNPMDSVSDVWMIGRTDSTGLGQAVSNAGFVNQTNSEGIISGGQDEHNSFGAAYLWLGGSFLDTTPDAWLKGVQGEGIGWYVSSAGDVDGDGKDEIMVSNYAEARSPKRVWVCKYTESGIEEPPMHSVFRIPLEIIPNPVKSQTTIRYTLNNKSKVSFKIYDIAGKVVRLIVEQNIIDPGNHEIRWDLRTNKQKRISAGIYFLEITVAQGNEILKERHKITVVK